MIIFCYGATLLISSEMVDVFVVCIVVWNLELDVFLVCHLLVFNMLPEMELVNLKF